MSAENTPAHPTGATPQLDHAVVRAQVEFVQQPLGRLGEMSILDLQPPGGAFLTGRVEVFIHAPLWSLIDNSRLPRESGETSAAAATRRTKRDVRCACRP